MPSGFSRHDGAARDLPALSRRTQNRPRRHLFELWQAPYQLSCRQTAHL